MNIFHLLFNTDDHLHIYVISVVQIKFIYLFVMHLNLAKIILGKLSRIFSLQFFWFATTAVTHIKSNPLLECFFENVKNIKKAIRFHINITYCSNARLKLKNIL